MAENGIARISAAELRELLLGDGEVALIDVREEGAFSRAHLLVASNVPAGRLELLIGDLAPRLDVPLVLCDEDERTAGWCAARLAPMGYTDLRVLAGGVGAWNAAGYALFDGVHVPSKAFGELVSETRHTPSITAGELRALLDGEAPPFLIDCRPKTEYAAWSLPGAIDLPGVELAYRLQQVDVPQGRKLVVNCAGRTRSIIGTQTLVDLGLVSDVAALENGLMGWRLGGFETGSGGPGMVDDRSRAVQNIRLPDAPAGTGTQVARAVAALAGKTGVVTLDWPAFAALRRKAAGRTLYLIDVRTPEEFLAGHHPDAVSAPGGQLIQETDRYVGVRNAILVLTDDTGVRAQLTGIWLRRLGWPEVYALPAINEQIGLVSGPRLPRLPDPVTDMPLVDVAGLQEKLRSGEAAVLDLSLSTAYQAGHIPGAWFGTRAKLESQLGDFPEGMTIVLVSEDGALAGLAYGDVPDWRGRAVFVLAGGMAAWRAANLPLETGMTHALSEPDDRWWQPERHPGGMAGFMRDYLSWEVGLVERVLADGTARYARHLIGA